MKKLNRLFHFAMAVAVSFGLASCGDDNGDGSDSTPDDNTRPEGDVYNPATSDKDYLEETAKLFLGYFDVNDQKELVETLGTLSEDYSYYDVPKDFVVDDEELEALRLSGRAVAKVCADGDLYNMSRAIITWTYNMARLSGVYNVDRDLRRWVRTGYSDDIVFNFAVKGKECELRVVGGGVTWNETILTEYRNKDSELVVIEVPTQLTLTLKRGGAELLRADLNTSYTSKTSGSIDANIKAMNLGMSVKVNATNSQSTENASFSVNGKTILSTSATVNGRNMCNYESWSKNMENFQDGSLLAQFFDDATATVNILGRVTVDAKLTDVKTFYDNIDYYADKNTSTSPKRDAQAIATAMQRSIEAKVTYAGSSDVRATLGWTAYERDTYYDEWAIRPLIIFTADNLPYTFEEYFGNKNFLSVENLFDSLMHSYEKVWNVY